MTSNAKIRQILKSIKSSRHTHHPDSRRTKGFARRMKKAIPFSGIGQATQREFHRNERRQARLELRQTTRISIQRYRDLIREEWKNYCLSCSVQ